MLLGIVKNFLFLGYFIIESFIFMWAFNYFAPWFSDNLFELPVIHIGYWITFCLFILIHFIGGFIKQLSPFSLSIKQKNEEKSK